MQRKAAKQILNCGTYTASARLRCLSLRQKVFRACCQDRSHPGMGFTPIIFIHSSSSTYTSPRLVIGDFGFPEMKVHIVPFRKPGALNQEHDVLLNDPFAREHHAC